jgi:hypothetical protein
VIKNMTMANGIDTDRLWKQISPDVMERHTAHRGTPRPGSHLHFLLLDVQLKSTFPAEGGAHHMHVAELPPTPENRDRAGLWSGSVLSQRATSPSYRPARRRLLHQALPSREIRTQGDREATQEPAQQLTKQGKKFAALFTGPPVIDSCERDHLYRLHAMDNKRLKGRSVNAECTLPCYKEHDTSVEASRARDLVADEPRQIIPELVPSPEGHLGDSDDGDDDDDDDDLINERYPRSTVTFCESPQAGLEEPVIKTDGKRDGTGEPEQRSATLDPAAEPDDEQESAGEQ